MGGTSLSSQLEKIHKVLGRDQADAERSASESEQFVLLAFDLEIHKELKDHALYKPTE
jgi:hypothetical protein